MKFKKTFTFFLILSTAFISILLQAGNPTYKEFNLSQSPVNLSISNRGALDAKSILNTSVLNQKQCAIAMAIGYCTFLNVSEVGKDLLSAGVSTDNINAILNSFNVNEWLATSFLESDIQGGISSGFYQIDDVPSNIYSDSSKQVWSQKYQKMVYVLGDNALFFDFLKGLGTDILYANTQQAFVWQSVEKGYYESLAYLLNKTNAKDNFNFAEWTKNYSAISKANTHYPLSPSEFSDINLSSTIGFAQSMWYMYNSGYSPFGNNSPLLHVWLNNSETFEDSIQYDNGSPHKAYIWRMAWLVTLLNNSKSIYTESVTSEDMIDLLNMLKGFYIQGKTTTDPVIEIGIAKSNSLKWGYAYNSPETFNNINSVVEAMLNQSIK